MSACLVALVAIVAAVSCGGGGVGANPLHFGDPISRVSGREWAVAFVDSHGHRAGVIRIDEAAAAHPEAVPDGLGGRNVRDARLFPLAGPTESSQQATPFLWCVRASASPASSQEVVIVRYWDFVTGFAGDSIELGIPDGAVVDWCCVSPYDDEKARVRDRPSIIGGTVPRGGGGFDSWARVVPADGNQSAPISGAPFDSILGGEPVHVGVAIDRFGAPVHTFVLGGQRADGYRAWRLLNGIVSEFAITGSLAAQIEDAERSGARIHPLAGVHDELLVIVLRRGHDTAMARVDAYGKTGLIGGADLRASFGAVRYGAALGATESPSVIVSRFSTGRCDAVWITPRSVSTVEVLQGGEANPLGADWGQRLWLSPSEASDGKVYRLLATRTGRQSNEARAWDHSIRVAGRASVTIEGVLDRYGVLVQHGVAEDQRR